MASWIGSTVYSKVKIHDGASVTGCTACFVTALVIGITTLGTNNIRVSVIGAVACMIAEAMPFWNDNVMIPIATASAVQWAMSF
jgi:dolichol kinase|eukprot:CAMPEP_0202482896 /NCGR_PEP_ID=MMETSP1361-20130828/2263_1 /ASSEMBLY_ACC=CAM_ASM_000849 /TAXON_ID=210615 /ORGANISM="Staurosira complex sp., Strain CCMP2646" /LENGTH=83 /DNA_ID=CAMNT_0049110975 /DNA_START=385 /DNA_END=636 /DNA_ORIENTATION=-